MTSVGRWAYLLVQLNLTAIMLSSFAMAVYVFYGTEVGRSSLGKPLTSAPVFFVGVGENVPTLLSQGVVFGVLWVLYLVLIVNSIFGHRLSLLSAWRSALRDGLRESSRNTMLSLTSVFSALTLIVYLLDLVQNSAGIPSGTLVEREPLETFTLLSLAPLTEEIGFRLSIIGLFGALFLAERPTAGRLLRILWHPSANLDLRSSSPLARWRRKSVTVLIVISAVAFGFAHIGYGLDPTQGWEIGKVTTSAISGIILGYMYVYYGLPGAILLHWSFNFLVGAYRYFDCSLAGTWVSCLEREAGPASTFLELSVFVAGGVSLLAFGLALFNQYRTRRAQGLLVPQPAPDSTQ